MKANMYKHYKNSYSHKRALSRGAKWIKIPHRNIWFAKEAFRKFPISSVDRSKYRQYCCEIDGVSIQFALRRLNTRPSIFMRTIPSKNCLTMINIALGLNSSIVIGATSYVYDTNPEHATYVSDLCKQLCSKYGTCITHSRTSFDDIKNVILALAEGNYLSQTNVILNTIKWFMNVTKNQTLRLIIVDMSSRCINMQPDYFYGIPIVERD